MGREAGAEVYQSACALPDRGYWCRPTLFTGVSQSDRVVQEEIFGPVLAIQTFRTLEEGLDKANNTPYGLSGGVWTDKGAKIFRMTQQIRAGAVALLQFPDVSCDVVEARRLRSSRVARQLGNGIQVHGARRCTSGSAAML